MKSYQSMKYEASNDRLLKKKQKNSVSPPKLGLTLTMSTGLEISDSVLNSSPTLCHDNLLQNKQSK